MESQVYAWGSFFRLNLQPGQAPNGDCVSQAKIQSASMSSYRGADAAVLMSQCCHAAAPS